LSFGVHTVSIDQLNNSLILDRLTFRDDNWNFCNSEETVLIESIKADSAQILGNSIALFSQSDNQTLVQVKQKKH
jgi:hypothetical protein